LEKDTIQRKKHQKFGKIDFGNQYEALKTKKTVVVIGYNDKYIIVHDPTDKDNVKILKEDFFKQWENAYKQAITLNN